MFGWGKRNSREDVQKLLSNKSLDRTVCDMTKTLNRPLWIIFFFILVSKPYMNGLDKELTKEIL